MKIKKGNIYKTTFFNKNPMFVKAESGILSDENGEQFFLANYWNDGKNEYLGNSTPIYITEEVMNGLHEVDKPINQCSSSFVSW